MRRHAFIAVVVAGVAAVPAASWASPDTDYDAIHADWQTDSRVTHCRWTTAELTNAQSIASITPTDNYTSFPAAVDAELESRGAHGCPAGVGADAPAPASRIRLVAAPASVREGVRTRVSFVVTAVSLSGGRVPVPGATVSLAGRRGTTDAQGRASVVVTLSAQRLAVARHAGLRLGRAVVRVR